MTQYGVVGSITEVETPTQIHREEQLSYVKDFETQRTLHRVTERIKVHNKKDETIQYLKFTDLVESKRNSGCLVFKEDDPTTRPTFTIMFPKTNIDGSYFVVFSYTESVL